MRYDGPNGLTLDLTNLLGTGRRKEFVGAAYGKREYRRTVILWFQGNTIEIPVNTTEERETLVNEILDIRFGNGKPPTQQT